ncbi:uncharacterized protein LOC121418146 isoform X2 [Lytechinus variegatus]|uniref:uncharacterized protein LOC121418146 isoform X2 n=1 Tax=Lytechinus variegatus TaxID=7654 RepID=UPI001BB10A7A|nr:uncharacterized protein LOC121418146 isoform X2 [Lytechinus variegatus]
MPRFFNTYSRLKPVSKKADVDAFSELQISRAAKRKDKVTALKSIAESETGDLDKEELADTFESKVTMKILPKPVSRKSSRRKPTPLKVEGKGLGMRYRKQYSPMARTSPNEDTSDDIDDSILYLSDFLEESTTLSDGETTLTDAETRDDSISDYSDIELPRDLPEQKRKSSTVSSRILKLSQMSNRKSHSKSHSKGEQNLSKIGKKAQMTTTSVYSLLSDESSSSLVGSPLKKLGNETKLKIAGKKVSLAKKSPTKIKHSHHEDNGESSAKDGKKQVSFQLKVNQELEDADMSTPFNVSLPHRSASNSILKKTSAIEPSIVGPGETVRATSTPQKSSRHSRKAHGCHIMDLSFDVSAVSLPPDHDLVITHKPKKPEKNQEVKQTQKLSEGPGETTEKLLDFEPMCLQASQHLDLGAETPVKDEKRRVNEMTPSAQLKRHSPEAGTPSKQLPKKSRILKHAGDAGLGNRKRLNYQHLESSEPTPECIITTLPFQGYNIHSSIAQIPTLQSKIDIRHIRQHPQDILETIPDRTFLHLKSAIGSHS